MLTTASQRKENTTNCLENLKKMMGVTKLASHSGEGGAVLFFGGVGGQGGHQKLCLKSSAHYEARVI